MTAILDYCVPSRRRERQERKEQLALASRVNPRWGDIQITAPSEGGWNQPGFFSEHERGLPVLPALPFVNGSPQNSGSSASTTPDLGVLYDKAVEAGITIETPPEVVQPPQPKEERKNISFTITLPWPSRRNSPPATHTRPTNSPPPGSESAKTNSRPSTAQSHHPATYIPASDRYMKDLVVTGKSPTHINPLAQSPPDRTVETFPVGTFPAQPENHGRDLASVGHSPSPPLPSGPSPVQHAAIDPVLRQRPSPPGQYTSPIMRLEPIPATPYCVDNFSHDPRLERPEAVIPSHPAVTERSGRTRSSSREAHSERYARMRSTSRGPTEDRSSIMRPSSRGGIEDRPSAVRSSSRSPAEDRVRSSSRAPTPDRAGAPRSSSRDPGPDRLGTARSSSREPRSSSRGPYLDRVGRPRSSSMGPAVGRITAVRSASREPTAERLAYSRGARHDSFSSDSSSATMFSDDLEDQKVPKKQHAPGSSIPNPTGIGHITVTQNGTTRTTGPGGYYSSLASEYRQIARDVENQALYDADSSDGKEHKKTIKDRLKDTYQEPQILVPHPTDLYG